MCEDDTFMALRRIPVELLILEVDRQPREWWFTPLDEYYEWFRKRGWTADEYYEATSKL